MLAKVKALHSLHPAFSVFLALAIGFAGTTAFLWYERGELRKQRAELSELLIAEQSAHARTKEELKSLIYHRDSLMAQLQEERAMVSALAEQVFNITGEVTTLTKLSKTDPELLQKYSKVFFLNEHYVPGGLTIIEKAYLNNLDKPAQVLTDIAGFLNTMLVAADKKGIELRVISAYRSFGTQSDLKTGYVVTYGTGTANQFSAEQGYSEHQLGTAVDFTTADIGDNFEAFAETEAYDWLMKNAFQYGFTLSYPEGNDYYQFEPWHWRFVGRDLARELYNDGRHFYDLEQREIDEYLPLFFD